jgi:hypothetical protein
MDTERQRYVRQSRSEEAKDDDRAADAERRQDSRRQHTDDERAAVRCCPLLCFVSLSFALVFSDLMQANAARRLVEPQRYSTRRDFHWSDPVCSSCRLIVPQVLVPSAAARQHFLSHRTDYDLHGIGARFQ